MISCTYAYCTSCSYYPDIVARCSCILKKTSESDPFVLRHCNEIAPYVQLIHWNSYETVGLSRRSSVPLVVFMFYYTNIKTNDQNRRRSLHPSSPCKTNPIPLEPKTHFPSLSCSVLERYYSRLRLIDGPIFWTLSYF